MRSLAKRILSAVAALASRNGLRRFKMSERNDEKPAGSQPRRKRSPEEVWAILESELDDEALDYQAKRVAAMSDEELDRELVAWGCDPEQVRADGVALVERMKQQLALEKAADVGSDESAT